MKRIWVLLLCGLLLAAGVTAGDEFEIIRQGSKGERVVRIQERLFDLGYYTYKPTGSYQTVTRSAVMRYQAESGLMNDGTIGQESYRALFSHNAVRVPFTAGVSLTYTAQSGVFVRGIGLTWETVKPRLVEGGTYTLTNATTGQSVTMTYAGGTNHAELTVPMRWNAPDRNVQQMLEQWLGSTNSYYKCAVLLNLDGQSVAGSIQWNANGGVCLYLSGSTSHVYGLPDVEHDALIKRITG